MVSPATRRKAAHHLLSAGFSRVRSCRASGLSVPASRRVPRDRNPGLRERVLELARANPRYGYRRLHVPIRREMGPINHKLVYRLYKTLNLEIRLEKRPKRTVSARPPRQAADGPNQRWSMDFMADRLEDGSRFRLLTLVDHFSRVRPAIAVGSSLTGRRVVEVLDSIPRSKLPSVIRVDNGPEFVSRALEAWACRSRVTLDFSRPGKPTDNAFIESFNARVRAECLDAGIFANLEEAREALEAFRLDYNTQRPHSSLGNQTPAEVEQGFYDQRRKKAG